MEITGMLYILPTVVLQVEAYLYNENINKTILSFTYDVWFLWFSIFLTPRSQLSATQIEVCISFLDVCDLLPKDLKTFYLQFLPD